MRKGRYLVANIAVAAGGGGVGDQLLKFFTLLNWARMSDRSLVVKLRTKSHKDHWLEKMLSHIPGSGLLCLLLSNSTRPSQVGFLADNVIADSLNIPRRIDGVAIYSIDEISFSAKLGVAWELIKNFYQKIRNKLLSKIHKLPAMEFNPLSPEELRQNKNIFFILKPERIPNDIKQAKHMKKISLKPKLNQTAAEFVKNNFAGKKIIGVHIRYMSPEWAPHNNHTKLWIDEDKTLLKLREGIQKVFDLENPEETIIFVATDQQHVLDYMKKHFASKLIYYPQKLGNKTGEMPVCPPKNMDKKLLHDNAVVDMFLLSQVDKLLYNTNSWFLLYPKSIVKDQVLI